MDYKQVTFRIDADTADFVVELLPAYLAEVGFDSFEENLRVLWPTALSTSLMWIP